MPGIIRTGPVAAQGAIAEEADRPLPADSLSEVEVASLTMPRSEAALRGALRGSLASLERQNEKLAAEGLTRIQDETELAGRIDSKLLVPLPASEALNVNTDLQPNHRYCSPSAAFFLADLAEAHQAAFHRPLEVSSAVRTVEYQQHLMRINGNAAPAEGEIASPHLTGATVDIAKSGMSRQEMDWMRQHLLVLEAAGKIDVEEEFKQACFHITVYTSYAPPRSVPQTPLTGRGDTIAPDPEEAVPTIATQGQ